MALKKLLIIGSILITLIIIVLVILGFSRQDESFDDTTSQELTELQSSPPAEQPAVGPNGQPDTSAPATSSIVNVEERYLLSKQASLPYENERIAITFRADQAQAAGITIIVIDKLRPSGASGVAINEANRYLEGKGIIINTVNIEYKGLQDAR